MNTDNKLENKNENISDYDEKEKDTLDSSDEENSDKKKIVRKKTKKRKNSILVLLGLVHLVSVQV